MEIGQTIAPTTTSQTSSATGSGTAISSDFNTFLQMLTAQVQNQDPLNPIESTDFAVQLATFSGVEQQVLTNELLEKMSADRSVSGLAELASWVGKEVRSDSYGYWSGTPKTLHLTTSDTADSAQLLIRNEAGEEVYRTPIAVGQSTFDWGGQDAAGDQLPEGLYRFDVINLENGLAVSEQPAEVYNLVNEVRFENGENVLVLRGGTMVKSSDVSALRAPLS